jgi:hypothetical protein
MTNRQNLRSNRENRIIILTHIFLAITSLQLDEFEKMNIIMKEAMSLLMHIVFMLSTFLKSFYRF